MMGVISVDIATIRQERIPHTIPHTTPYHTSHHTTLHSDSGCGMWLFNVRLFNVRLFSVKHGFSVKVNCC